jgi:hypothetical protein
MSHRSWLVASAAAAAVFVIGCANGSSPAGPSSAPINAAGSNVAPQASGPPDYEQAYYNGTIVTMNHIEVPQSPGALVHAAADLYAVIYPANHALWPLLPLCNPCVHNGNPIFHDHVLDSIPSAPGHGEFNPLWHVFIIRPAGPSLAAQMAYAGRLPMKSEADVDKAIADGVAVEVDTGSYFLCSIVNEHAAK